MTTADTIACPKCGTMIPLSEALSARIGEEAAKQIQLQQAEREHELREEFDARLQKDISAATAKATADMDTTFRDLQAANDEKAKKLEEAQRTELKLRQQQRELEEGKKQLELEVARRLDEERKGIETATAERVAESHRLREREKDEQLTAMKKTIEELKRKADQGSQQLQGEAAELELEDLLRGEFPMDRIDPVSKGTRGADIIHTVVGPSGAACGTIIWELKRTKNWSDAWLGKLRDDQRDQKAQLAVLVSVTVPPDVRAFALIDRVWVCQYQFAGALAHAMRSQLLSVASARVASEGRETKAELLYGYLSGPEFKQRIEAIAEAFLAMQGDLGRERAAMERTWSKREKQLAKALANVGGLFGDVQGIAGGTLPEIAQLSLPPGDEPAVEE